MQKIKVENMACFEQVAKVIGKSNAKRELFIALNDHIRYDVNPELPLEHSFIWAITPQEHDFWDMIDDGISPYNQ